MQICTKPVTGPGGGELSTEMAYTTGTPIPGLRAELGGVVLCEYSGWMISRLPTLTVDEQSIF